jgi:hypothetical protein
VYLVFVGTTDHIDKLKEYLKDVPHTLLEGTGVWLPGVPLNAQVVITFKLQPALLIRRFLKEECGQQCVPIHRLPSEEVGEPGDYDE